MKAWLSAPVLLLFVDGIWAKLEFRTKNSAGLGKTWQDSWKRFGSFSQKYAIY